MPTVDPDSIPSSWLVEKLERATFESVLRYDLERAQLVDADIDEMIREAIPKGQKKWQEFTSVMKDGDEFWFFSNSKDDWASFSGRSGYAVVRDGKVIAAEITAMS